MARRWTSFLSLAVIYFSSTGLGQVINSTNCGDGTVTMWAMWSGFSGLGDCSVMCVGETGEVSRQRTRTCPVPVTDCDAEQFEVQFFACNGDSPAVDGGVGQWVQWENINSCSALCGTGQVDQTRSRQCDNPEPSCGGDECTQSGPLTQARRVSCFEGSCGNLCLFRRFPVVLSSTDTRGFFLLCIRGSVIRVACPMRFDFRAYFAYGFSNAVRMFRVCNFQ